MCNHNILIWFCEWNYSFLRNKCNFGHHSTTLCTDVYIKCNKFSAMVKLIEFNLTLVFSWSLQFRIPLSSIDPGFVCMIFISQNVNRVQWLFGSDFFRASGSLQRSSAIISCIKEVLSLFKWKQINLLHCVLNKI